MLGKPRVCNFSEDALQISVEGVKILQLENFIFPIGELNFSNWGNMNFQLKFFRFLSVQFLLL